jgi:HlyD family secretion protein
MNAPSRALVVCIALAVAACNGEASESTVQRPVMTVELAAPTAASWPEVISASGEIAPWQEAVIGSEVAGVRLDEVLVNVGDVVTKGQVLARYSEDSLEAELSRLRALVAEAKANLAKAQADKARADKMGEIHAISEQAMQMYATQVEVAKAQVDSARAARDAQKLRLEYARVVAPDDGVISSRTATIGSVGTLGAELFRLVRGNRLEWRAELPAEALARLKPGVIATLRTPSGETVTGTLRQVSPTVDRGTRNGIAYVDLPKDSGLAAGLYVAGRFALDARQALAVPESAIVLRDGNRYLMRVDADNRIQEVKVATGRRQGDAIEILDGVEPGDRFVRSGGAFVSDGDLVQVATPKS